MGIHHFYSWLASTNTIEEEVPKYVGSLSIDCNGIIYKAVNEIYGIDENIPRQMYEAIANAESATLEAQLHQVISNELTAIIAKAAPTNLLCIAVDGLAPGAKINQQRGRRYKAAQEEIEKEESSKAKGVKMGTVNKNEFDMRSITPGTLFMQRLDEWFKLWIASRARQLPPNIIYSPHTSAGEGEHKIFEFMRKGFYQQEKETGKNNIPEVVPAHVIYGMDADLTLLSLNAKLPRIYLVRENFSQIVNIDALRSKIVKWLTINGTVEIPEAIAIQDFILMLNFIGNDFLPHLICFSSVPEAIERMFVIYNRLKEPLTNDEYEIVWPAFSLFVAELAALEKTMLAVVASESYDTPYTALVNSSTTVSHPPEEGKMVGRTETTIDYDKFRGEWYAHIFMPVSEEGKKYTEKEAIEVITTQAITDMCREYLKGLQWILLYYTGGTDSIDKSYLYRYYYAPLLSDLSICLAHFIDVDLTPQVEEVDNSHASPEFTYIHQLLAVIPPKSFALIPAKYRHLVMDGGALSDMAPSRFVVDYSGTRNGKPVDTAKSRNAKQAKNNGTRYKGIALLPIIDMQRVVDAVKQWFDEGDVTVTTDSVISNSASGFVGGERDAKPRRDYSNRGRGGFNNESRGRGRGGFNNNESRGRGGYRGRGGFRGDSSEETRGRGGYRGRGGVTSSFSSGMLM